jgi:chlorophyllase-like protein
MHEGETFPVITWANGTCGLTHGYSVLLSGLASYGFVVIASNSTWTNTAPTNKVQQRALDYAAALNNDTNSVLYHRLDMGKVGAMGHSQGAAATGTADDDPRVKAVIFWNTGTSNVKPFLNVSGDRDVGGVMMSSVSSSTNSATQPGAWVFYHQVLQTGGNSTGHLVLMEQPDRVIDMAVAWWKWQLKGDMEAKNMFVGSSCGLCNRKAEFDYGANSRLQ